MDTGAMPAAVDVQRHPWQWTPWSSLAMHSALASPRHQPDSLQSQFYPGVAEFNLVLCPQLLMKMPHVQIEIILPRNSCFLSRWNSDELVSQGGGFPLELLDL
jgi:hypothetical protein